MVNCVKLFFYRKGNTVNMNNATQLKLLGLTPEAVWSTKIFGSFGEPIRCYIYHPQGVRSTGFSTSVSGICVKGNIFASFFKIIFKLTVITN
jgi:hypothetical protein